MRPSILSSGDLVADRRYAFGVSYQQAGDLAAAIDLFEQAIERAPEWPAAWLALGRARRESGDAPGAIKAFRECLQRDPADALGASLDLTLLDAAVHVDAAPAAYVETLFDAYASDFEKALVERLQYTTPTAIAGLVENYLSLRGADDQGFARALDLGCGTGLAGDALRSRIAFLEGVDLSSAMVCEARNKGVYDNVVCRDLLSHLKAGEDRFDLILAADVFNYLGDLAQPFLAMAARLAPHAIAAFSVERGAHVGWRLNANMRFTHAPDYVRATANAAGLELVDMRASILRKDRGEDVDGLVVLLRKRAGAESVATDAGLFSKPSPIAPLH